MLIIHATAGICNLCCSPEFQPSILQPDFIENLKFVLKNKENCDIKVNILTTFILILNQVSYIKELICSPNFIQTISKLRNNECKNLSNLANIFIEDFATRFEEINR